jgi:ABC-type glycerol-3-phosphate transport system permease component
MNFVLPQFIDMEARIVGPLTLKQFAFVGGGGALSFVIYFSLGKTSLPFAIALIAIIMGISCALAFVKMDGISLPLVMRHWANFMMSPQIFLWNNFSLPRQIVGTQEKITIQKAPTSVKIEATAQKDNLVKIRDYLETH